MRNPPKINKLTLNKIKNWYYWILFNLITIINVIIVVGILSLFIFESIPVYYCQDLSLNQWCLTYVDDYQRASIDFMPDYSDNRLNTRSQFSDEDNRTLFNLFHIPRSLNPMHVGSLLRCIIIVAKCPWTWRPGFYLVLAPQIRFLSYGPNSNQSVSLFRFPGNTHEISNNQSITFNFRDNTSTTVICEGLVKLNVFRENPNFVITNPISNLEEVYNPANPLHQSLSITRNGNFVCISRGYVTHPSTEIISIENPNNLMLTMADNIEM